MTAASETITVTQPDLDFVVAEEPIEPESEVTLPDPVSQLDDAFNPESEILTLSSGFQARILPLKTRQFFKLLRVLTRGAAPFLADPQFRLTGTDSDEFMDRLSALLLVAVPEADDEAIEFLQAMVEPAELVTGPLNKEQIQTNRELRTQLVNELTNPELEDLIELVSAIIRHEAQDIQSLGKKLQRMMGLAQKTGIVSIG